MGLSPNALSSASWRTNFHNFEKNLPKFEDYGENGIWRQTQYSWFFRYFTIKTGE
jgi:hypothetical protein